MRLADDSSFVDTTDSGTTTFFPSTSSTDAYSTSNTDTSQAVSTPVAPADSSSGGFFASLLSTVQNTAQAATAVANATSTTVAQVAQATQLTSANIQRAGQGLPPLTQAQYNAMKAPSIFSGIYKSAATGGTNWTNVALTAAAVGLVGLLVSGRLR